MRKIQIYDTTLRDGTQRKDISLSCEDKINIALRLDALGVDFIEGGWPGSNPKDVEFFTRAAEMTWKHAKIAAFGATCGVNKTPQEDANINALIEAATPYCTVVGKTSILHVKEVLRTTLENNLRIIEESLAYLKAKGRCVIYDAEHFFDGYKEDPAYAIETLKAAVRGGAETAVLCDTNGGAMPWEIAEVIRTVKSQVSIPLGIHTHNDSESAVMNAIAAVEEGCIQVQGTINGYGERCGNANLCSIIPTLELKLGYQALPAGNLPQISEISRYVAALANLAYDEHLPYVGRSAFAHKGGIHVSAIRRNVNSYQHIDPALVGNKMTILVSELSGRGNLISKAEEYGVTIQNDEQVTHALSEVKKLESQGYSFEAAEASIVMLFKRHEKNYHPPFELIDFSSIVEHRQGRGLLAEATVKVRVNGEIIHTAAEGNGPVNALDTALRKALADRYPNIHNFYLADFKVRILDGKKGTGAVTRVLIDTRSAQKSWTTVGASPNIIEASWLALVDAIEYGLISQ